MQKSAFKIVIPCLFIVVLTMIPLMLNRDYFPLSYPNTILDELKAKEDIAAALHKMEDYLRFLSSNTVVPTHTLSFKPIADMRFQAAQILSKRDGSAFQQEAFKQYQMIDRIYPSYNHGWVQYLSGSHWEKLQVYGNALQQYKRVPLYNHSHLALDAQYRLELMNKAQEFTIQAQPVYHYLRFSAPDAAGASIPFSTTQLSGKPYSNFIQSLNAYAEEKSGKAVQFMQSHIEQNPADYSAKYYLDFMRGKTGQKYYPLNGELMSSCFANGALSRSGLSLPENHSVLMDFYRSEPDPKQRFEIQIFYETGIEQPFLFFLTLNRDPNQILQITPNPTGTTISNGLAFSKRHNVLELYWRMVDSSPSTGVESPAIRFASLRLTPVSMETTQ